MFSVKFTQSC